MKFETECVCLYSFHSGLSPFLDDSDDETTDNILRCDFSFPAEYFSHVSNEAKDLISRLLTVNPAQRATATYCLNAASWLKQNAAKPYAARISSIHLSTLVRRRLKKLNSVAPLGMTNAKIPTRPESLYGGKKMP